MKDYIGIFIGIFVLFIIAGVMFTGVASSQDTIDASSRSTNLNNHSLTPCETGVVTLSCPSGESYLSFNILTNQSNTIPASNYTIGDTGTVCAVEDRYNNTQVNTSYYCQDNNSGSGLLGKNGIILLLIAIAFLIIIVRASVKK